MKPRKKRMSMRGGIVQLRRKSGGKTFEVGREKITVKLREPLLTGIPTPRRETRSLEWVYTCQRP